MTGLRDDGSFFEKFRARREDKRRIDALRTQAEGLKDRVAPEIADRVIRDLGRRSHEVEETERQELKAFVQGLKERREELKRTEQEIDELDFRKLIGEIDEVELQIRKESLSLKVREQRRFLERDLEEYKALRSFVDKDELPAGLTKAESIVESAAAAAAASGAAAPEPTITFDSFRMKRPPTLTQAPSSGGAPKATPSPVERPAPAAPPAPPAAAPAPPPAAPPTIPVPPTIPKIPAAPAAARSRAVDPQDPPTVRVGSRSRESSPTARPTALPPLVVQEAQESIIVNQDFLARAPVADEALDGLDDLSQLDALSRSLDRMARGGGRGDLAPIAMATALRNEESGAQFLEGIPSSPALQEEESESTLVKRPESQTLNVPQPMLILKNKDGTERASFVLKLGVSTMGRGLDNECVLDDRAVSRKHATITFESDGTFRLTDLGSENGTYVNGQRVSTHVLKDGDEVHMGKSTLVFSLGK